MADFDKWANDFADSIAKQKRPKKFACDTCEDEGVCMGILSTPAGNPTEVLVYCWDCGGLSAGTRVEQ